MQRTLFTIITFLTISLSAYAQNHDIPKQAPFIAGMDALAAKKYCDTAPIRDPEGIYLWPEHDATILIRARKHAGPTSRPNIGYEIITVDCSDLRFEPGQILGYIYPTPAANEYHLYLYDDISLKGAHKPKHHAAKYDTTHGSLQILRKKHKFTFNPLVLIPRMRSLLRYQTADPAADLPDGFLRLYPATIPSPGTSAAPYPRYY